MTKLNSYLGLIRFYNPIGFWLLLWPGLWGLFLSDNFNIENFTSKKITYKIIYNSTPDKFLKLLNLNGFKVDTSTETWKIYE